MCPRVDFPQLGVVSEMAPRTEATHRQAAGPAFHQRYAGTEGIYLGEEPVLVEVNLVRYSGLPALVGAYCTSSPSCRE